jgi:hypothetical protein
MVPEEQVDLHVRGQPEVREQYRVDPVSGMYRSNVADVLHVPKVLQGVLGHPGEEGVVGKVLQEVHTQRQRRIPPVGEDGPVELDHVVRAGGGLVEPCRSRDLLDDWVEGAGLQPEDDGVVIGSRGRVQPPVRGLSREGLGWKRQDDDEQKGDGPGSQADRRLWVARVV